MVLMQQEKQAEKTADIMLDDALHYDEKQYV